VTTETRIAEPQEFAAVSVKGVVWLAVGFGLLKYVLSTLGQITIQHAGYGVFRDELYFIVCGRHLAWGYVDQPPVIPLVARISEFLFGLQSLAVQGRLERPSGLRLPALLEFVNCRNVRVENCYTQNYGMWSIHPTYSDNVTFKNVVVKSGADGIDVDSCKHVAIDGCDFDTTDDCISLKSGRGIEGYTISRATEDVHISHCTFVDKVWACIGIGSETSGGIRDVHVDHCKCLGAGTFAIYIKSRPGRGAFIENIYMNDLDVSGTKNGFLRFNILNSGIADTPNLVPGDAGIPTIRNFEFRNIKVTDMPELVDGIDIHPRKPLDGFVLENVSGTCKKGISLANIKNAHLSGIKVTGYDGPLLLTSNVSGTGLAGAKPIKEADMPKVPDPILPPAELYKLH
jgi:polygalacturonase